MPNFHEQCGCTFSVAGTPTPAGPAYALAWIKCPLHKAAEEMLASWQEYFAATDEKEVAITSQDFDAARVAHEKQVSAKSKARAAITKATKGA